MTHAVVQLTLQVTVGDQWSTKTTIGQINDQAIESAIGLVARLVESQKRTHVFKIIGKPVVSMVTHTVESK